MYDRKDSTPTNITDNKNKGKKERICLLNSEVNTFEYMYLFVVLLRYYVDIYIYIYIMCMGVYICVTNCFKLFQRKALFK